MDIGFWQLAQDLGVATMLFIGVLGYLARRELLNKLNTMEEKEEQRAKLFHGKFEKQEEEIKNITERVAVAETDIEHVAGTRWKRK